MKKSGLVLISVLMAMIMLFTCGAAVSYAETEESGLCGDINSDGAVDTADLSALRECLLGETSYETEIADYNGNGTVDIRDLVHMYITVAEAVGASYTITFMDKDNNLIIGAQIYMSEMTDDDFHMYSDVTDENGQIKLSAADIARFIAIQNPSGTNCNIYSEINENQRGFVYTNFDIDTFQYTVRLAPIEVEYEEVIFAFYYRDGFTPVANADIIIFNMETHGFDAVTDESGRYTMSKEDVEKFKSEDYSVWYNIFVGDRTADGELEFLPSGTPLINVITSLEFMPPEPEAPVYSDIVFTLTDSMGNPVTDGSVVLYFDGQFNNAYSENENGVYIISGNIFTGWPSDTEFTYSISTSRGYDPNNNPYADHTDVRFDPLTQTEYSIQLDI